MKYLYLLICLISTVVYSQDKNAIGKNLDREKDRYADIAKQIWDWAELGYQEINSSNLLAQTLEEEGFTLQRGLAGIPTSFIAEYGSGSPVIAVLAEFDALPGISQKAIPTKEPVIEGGSGHACGHHLFGTASTAAGIEVKNWLVKNKMNGTIRVYGTPAEEGGAGKVYMVRAGLFDDVDVALHWHPGSQNAANPGSPTRGEWHF